MPVLEGASTMDIASITDEIAQVRKRLAALDQERADLAEDAFAEKADLLDEEHRLRSRLGELQDQAAEAGVGRAEKVAADQVDTERVPDLPPSDAGSAEAMVAGDLPGEVPELPAQRPR
jgi:hypothetical protein